MSASDYFGGMGLAAVRTKTKSGRDSLRCLVLVCGGGETGMRKQPAHLVSWAQSAEFREIARRQCEKMNRAHALKPRCTATAKHSGEPCRQPGMKNGKCRFHGGRTPSGDDWHRPRWPKRDAPNAAEKLAKKLGDLRRRAREREKRLARRSPEGLAAYRAWQRSHQPGSATRRASDRERRKRDREAAEMIAAGKGCQSDVEANQALYDQIAALKAQLRELGLREAIEMKTGVFG